jgi:hypothetical protein
MQLEDEPLRATSPTKDAEKIKTVGDAVEFIKQHHSKLSAPALAIRTDSDPPDPGTAGNCTWRPVATCPSLPPSRPSRKVVVTGVGALTNLGHGRRHHLGGHASRAGQRHLPHLRAPEVRPLRRTAGTVNAIGGQIKGWDVASGRHRVPRSQAPGPLLAPGHGAAARGRPALGHRLFQGRPGPLRRGRRVGHRRHQDDRGRHVGPHERQGPERISPFTVPR